MTPNYKVGQRVMIVAIEMVGTVSGVLEEASCITYRVAYWNDGVRRCEWLHDFEIREIAKT